MGFERNIFGSGSGFRRNQFGGVGSHGEDAIAPTVPTDLMVEDGESNAEMLISWLPSTDEEGDGDEDDLLETISPPVPEDLFVSGLLTSQMLIEWSPSYDEGAFGAESDDDYLFI